MQKKALSLVSGIHRLFPDNEAATVAFHEREPPMAKTAAIAYAPTTSLFSRLLAAIDRTLAASARASLRNGDLPRFGL
jgi:hypothetical protein